MGCSNSKGNGVRSSPTTSVGVEAVPREPGTVCHFCKKRIPEKELNSHTVMCDEREVTCWNSWCREIVKQGNLSVHMEQCAKKQKTICSKCGAHVLVRELTQHRDMCQLQPCAHCGESCISRILKYCPTQTLGKVQIVSGPFATEALRQRFGCSTDRPSALAVANFNVSRLQQLWRWMKTRTIVEDTIFRLIHKEMDLKKEGFAIFKAHDKTDATTNQPTAKRSRSVIQNPVVAPASNTHYFPSNPQVPITFEHIRLMIRDFTNHTLIPYPAAWRILTDTLAHLNTMPNVVRLSPPVGARVIGGRTVQGGKTVVVGDLHGQLADLLHILRECGQPDEGTYYVFNGDFVDRGQYGVEVLLILFSLMLAFPKYVTLNRGNHECDYMNEEYGFDVEVSTKYDRNVFRLMQRCFCALPLATMVGSTIFIVHGGLPRRKGVTIEDIGRIQRFRQIPMPEHKQPEEDEMFQDLLWSDPWENSGWKESERGAGVQFGYDVTENFCLTNKVERVIRSHEEYQKGYEEHHRGRLITVFSASNYDGEDTNKGCFIVLVGDNPEPSYHLYQCYEDELEEYTGQGTEALGETFTSLSMTPTTIRMGSFSSNMLKDHRPKKRVRDEVLRVLRERIYLRRHRMLAYFTKLDRTRKGSVWKIEWVETMRNVLNLHLPWFFLRHYIVGEDPHTGRIAYALFLYKMKNRLSKLWMPDWEQNITQQLAARQRTAQRAQHIQAAFNKDSVNYNEFCSAIRTIDYTMSDAQLFQLFQLYDTHARAHVDGRVLLEDFQNSKTAGAVVGAKWDLDAMDQLQTVMIQARSQLQTVFKVSAKDKVITREKFFNGMAQLSRGMKKQLTTAQKELIFGFLLQPGSGRDDVDWDTFVKSFAVVDTSDSITETRRTSVADFDPAITPVVQVTKVYPMSPVARTQSPEPS